MSHVVQRSCYDEDIEQRYSINKDTYICKRKIGFLREYYKKRDLWTDADDLTNEYKGIISLLKYLHDTVFGGTNQEYFNSITKKLLTIDKPIIVIDEQYHLKQDIWDCVTGYEDGFTDYSNGQNFTPEQIEQQTIIINMTVKISNNPNFISIFQKSIDACRYIDVTEN